MDKNPLSTLVIVFVIGDLLTGWQAISRHSVSVLTVVSWIQCIGLVILVFKQSRYAGTYLFYSVAPVFPIYLGLKLAGITKPLLPSVYVIMSIVYLIVMWLLWQMKRNYDRFIAKRESESTA